MNSTDERIVKLLEAWDFAQFSDLNLSSAIKQILYDGLQAVQEHFRLAAAPVQPSEEDAALWLKEAKRLYARWTDEQGIHCNRFPAWSELSLREHSKWIDKARATPAVAEATAPSTENAEGLPLAIQMAREAQVSFAEMLINPPEPNEAFKKAEASHKRLISPEVKAEPVATLIVRMETIDTGQAPAEPPYRSVHAHAIYEAASDLPVGEYPLYLTAPIAPEVKADDYDDSKAPVVKRVRKPVSEVKADSTERAAQIAESYSAQLGDEIARAIRADSTSTAWKPFKGLGTFLAGSDKTSIDFDKTEE